ncbi:diguanylate cyclase domain-containing protein [uncultured Anaeromusa sp.]|uniref:GGDEF domain-containing protein n=1 Tax=uncultured Anaeromusa sp. TaxID=673273 RepID=UPI0029C93543|nr:diguanylate cyclase [uncultured Anaeromusa sp.]
MLVIQMNIFMVLLLSLVAVHAFSKLPRRTHVEHRVFLALLVLTMLMLILEIFSVVLNSPAFIGFITVHKLVDTIGFTLTPLVPIFALLFIRAKTGSCKNINRKIVLWLGVPLFINTILSIGSFHFNWIFTITNENLYLRGPLWFASPLTSYFYYAANLLLLYKARNKFQREELFMLSLLILSPGVLSVFQLYFFVYLTLWNSIAIAVVVNYILIVQSQIKIDPLTRLGNRAAYDDQLEILSRKENLVLTVVNIDMDNFKTINDTYGHQEGDKVLKIFAGHIKEVFDGKGVSIRLGGDEFIVLVNENRKEIVETYIKSLKSSIKAYNENSGMPYQIKFSYGMAIFNSSYKDVHELVRYSDKLMYQEKNKRTNQSR